MDLVKLITGKLQEVESSGKLEEIIEKHVLTCVDDIVKDSFKWSGEAKKSIELALKDKLGIEFENVKLPQYQKIVSDIVNNTLNNTVIKDLESEISEAVRSVTEVLERKEWTLSEIIKMYIESLDTSYDGEMEDQYGLCSLIIDESGNFAHIYFDKNSDKEKYMCENKLFLYKNKLSGVTYEEKPFSPFEVRTMDSFEKYLFKLYCSNVTIIIDGDKCELEYYREDCN